MTNELTSLKVWFIFKSADIGDNSYVGDLSPLKNKLVLAEHVCEDLFLIEVETNGGSVTESIYLFNENTTDKASDHRIEILDMSDISTQDEIAALGMIYPDAGFESLTIEMIKHMKAFLHHPVGQG